VPGGGPPDEVEFTTKPRQAQAMVSRAIEAGGLSAWFTADEAYGQAKYGRDRLLRLLRSRRASVADLAWVAGCHPMAIHTSSSAPLYQSLPG
jgi:hypothetical protein